MILSQYLSHMARIHVFPLFSAFRVLPRFFIRQVRQSGEIFWLLMISGGIVQIQDEVSDQVAVGFFFQIQKTRKNR